MGAVSRSVFRTENDVDEERGGASRLSEATLKATAPAYCPTSSEKSSALVKSGKLLHWSVAGYRLLALDRTLW